MNGEPLKKRKGEVAMMNLKNKNGKNNFDPAYCITCYRYQGDTIEGEYNIHQSYLMDFNEFYTSLSRDRKLDDIHFNYTLKKFKKAKEKTEPTLVGQMKCAEGYIYAISNETIKKFYGVYRENS